MTSYAGRMVSWLRSWRAGLAPYDDAVQAVAAGDDHDEVADLPGTAHTVSLSAALSHFRQLRPDEIRLVLPVPGDPRGLPGPGALTTAALAAGEVAICGQLGLVPEVTKRVSGSGDSWETVLWRVYGLPVDPLGRPVAGQSDPLSVTEAEHDLLTALHASTDLLRELEVAGVRPESAPAIGALRERPDPLPPGYDSRAQRLLDRASMVAGTLRLADRDEGTATTAHLIQARSEALRPLATTARRGMLAAYNAPLR